MSAEPPPFTLVQRCLFLFFISLVTLLIVLDYSIANIAIPYIAGGLSVSVDQGIYVITFFSIGNAIGLAMTGWLTRQVGQVRLVLLSVALFTFFSWICGLAPNLLILVIARFIQGLVAGPMLPLSQAILIKEAKPEHRARDLSLWSTTVITGPVLGPLLGGYIAYWYNWSWIFYINIPIGIACFIVLWWLLRNRETEIETIHSDIPGIFLLSVAVTCFQIFLDKGQQWDWWNSNAICAAFITCIVTTVFFIIRELGTPYPFFQIRLLKIFSFSFAILLLFVTYGIYFGSIVIVPLWLQEFMGYDAIKAGIAVAPLGIGPILLYFGYADPNQKNRQSLDSCFEFLGLWSFSLLYLFFPYIGRYRAHRIFPVSHGSRICLLYHPAHPNQHPAHLAARSFQLGGDFPFFPRSFGSGRRLGVHDDLGEKVDFPP